MSVLTVRDLVSGYTDSDILHGVSIDIDEGEIVSLLGPNGSGKSTLVKSILKTHEVSIVSGTVEFKGSDVTDSSHADLIGEGGISYVPQNRSSFPDLSVRDNLVLGGYRLDDKEKVREGIEVVFDLFPPLAERESAAAATLSGGQQRMLEFGRALVTDPDLLFLDEPSIGLAPQISEQVFDQVETINREKGVSLLIVEQNPKRSLDVSDRAYILDQGEIVIADTPERILEDNDLSDLYLGGLSA